MEMDRDEGRTILLRLGSEANRTDRQAFDAAFTVLEARVVSDDGFFGAWRSGVGTERSDGYFCAVREAS